LIDVDNFFNNDIIVKKLSVSIKQGRSDWGWGISVFIPPKSAQVNFLWGKNDVRTDGYSTVLYPPKTNFWVCPCYQNSHSQTAMESVWSVSKLSTESVGSRHELVANCVHTTDADATKQFRHVGGVYWA